MEREVKLAARPAFELPDLSDVVPGAVVEEAPTLDLDAVYVDTADLVLVRHGVSLRRRTGEGAPRWTLKLPAGATSGIALSRREFDVESDALEVPGELADLVTGWVRGRAVEPVTAIRTRRRRRLLRGTDGAELAELDDDEVSVVDPDGRFLVGFREVEVELAGDAEPAVLERVAEALTAAGAGAPDTTTKVVRALGPRALAPPDLAPVEAGSTVTAGEVLTEALRVAVRRIVDSDHVIRLDDGVEGVHRARVGARRLRAALGTFGGVVDEAWARDLRAELGWLGRLLGPVRDLDVVIDALRADVDRLPDPDRAAAARVVDRLVADRQGHLAELLAGMRSDRYVELLGRAVAAADHPRLGPEADRVASEVLPAMVRTRWRRLRRAVAAFGEHPSDDALHGVRIAAKRVRYAVAVAAPVVGEPAIGLARALARLQDELGELHDAVVAESWLRETAPGLDPVDALASGELIAARRARAELRRSSWRDAWDACDRPDLRRWMR